MVKLILKKSNRKSIVYQFNEALKNIKKNNGVLNQEGIRFVLEEYKLLKYKVKVLRNLTIFAMVLPLMVIALVLLTGTYNVFVSTIMISGALISLYLMVDMLLLLKNEFKETEQIISELR